MATIDSAFAVYEEMAHVNPGPHSTRKPRLYCRIRAPMSKGEKLKLVQEQGFKFDINPEWDKEVIRIRGDSLIGKVYSSTRA